MMLIAMMILFCSSFTYAFAFQLKIALIRRSLRPVTLSSKSIAPISLSYRHPSSLFMSANNESSSSKDGIEPKYLVALVVFLIACVIDKVTMHGGF